MLKNIFSKKFYLEIYVRDEFNLPISEQTLILDQLFCKEKKASVTTNSNGFCVLKGEIEPNLFFKVVDFGFIHNLKFKKGKNEITVFLNLKKQKIDAVNFNDKIIAREKGELNITFG